MHTKLSDIVCQEKHLLKPFQNYCELEKDIAVKLFSLV